MIGKQLLRTSLLLFVVTCSFVNAGESSEPSAPSIRSELRITRQSGDHTVPLTSPELVEREVYPWEERLVGGYPRITKYFFRCNGEIDNPIRRERLLEADLPIEMADCGGVEAHSLPIHNDEEFIYPILLTLLNYIQGETGKKIIVTCGYRCPMHNTYADSSVAARISKHMVGAEVDFYVEGLEQEPNAVLQIIKNYFKKDPLTAGKPEFENFERYEKSDTNVSIKPWFNKEVFVKMYQSHEGRDYDNRHTKPYIGIQVRWDRDLEERVVYSWEIAHKEYFRW